MQQFSSGDGDVSRQQLRDLLLRFPCTLLDGLRWSVLCKVYRERFPESAASLTSSPDLARAWLHDLADFRDDPASIGDGFLLLWDSAALTLARDGQLACWPLLVQRLGEIVRRHGSEQHAHALEVPHEEEEMGGADGEVKGVLLAQLKPLLRRHWDPAFEERAVSFFSETGNYVSIKKMKHLIAELVKWRTKRRMVARTQGWRTAVDVSLEAPMVLAVSQRHNDMVLCCPSRWTASELPSQESHLFNPHAAPWVMPAHPLDPNLHYNITFMTNPGADPSVATMSTDSSAFEHLASAKYKCAEAHANATASFSAAQFGHNLSGVAFMSRPGPCDGGTTVSAGAATFEHFTNVSGTESVSAASFTAPELRYTKAHPDVDSSDCVFADGSQKGNSPRVDPTQQVEMLQSQSHRLRIENAELKKRLRFDSELFRKEISTLRIENAELKKRLFFTASPPAAHAQPQPPMQHVWLSPVLGPAVVSGQSTPPRAGDNSPAGPSSPLTSAASFCYALPLQGVNPICGPWPGSIMALPVHAMMQTDGKIQSPFSDASQQERLLPKSLFGSDGGSVQSHTPLVSNSLSPTARGHRREGSYSSSSVQLPSTIDDRWVSIPSGIVERTTAQFETGVDENGVPVENGTPIEGFLAPGGSVELTARQGPQQQSCDAPSGSESES